MSGNKGAYGARAGDTDFRKKWDKEEYAEKARQRDQEEKERMQENEERLKQGTLVMLFLLVMYLALNVLCVRKEATKVTKG